MLFMLLYNGNKADANLHPNGAMFLNSSSRSLSSPFPSPAAPNLPES